MKLSDLSDKQIIRLWRLAHQKLYTLSGIGQWDWPTLRVCYPGWHNTLKAIQQEGTNRRI